MQHKSFALEIKSLDESGSFTGLASVYGVKDLQGDIVLPGAFTASIAAKGGQVPILWQHSMDQPIGIGSVEDSQYGLTIKGQLTMAVEKAAEAYALLKAGVVKGLSIGYDTVTEKFEEGVRKLSAVDLWEVSVVTFPANPLANVTTVKSLTDMANEVKAGRVLSKRNLESLQAAIDALQTILSAATDPITDEPQLVDAVDQQLPIAKPEKSAPAPTAGDGNKALSTDGLKALIADIQAAAKTARA